jgi:hypothetical protein
MDVKNSVIITLMASAVFPSLLLYPVPIRSTSAPHEKIVVRGYDGNPLTMQSKTPYSPKKTCGTCHDYNRITNGYHFQLGRTDGTGKIVISDSFDEKRPWNLSSGMYGKLSWVSPDMSQLAKKINRNPSEIDKSSFYFIQNCGACHPGGGPGEYDREGNLYYNQETTKWEFELSGDDPTLDGDYTFFSAGDASFRAPWGISGGSEADCLVCHLQGYQWKERAATLRGRFFKYGPTVGAGWATVELSPDEFGSSKTDQVNVDYSRKEVGDFENLHLQIMRQPADENCWFCHSASDGKRRGNQWSSEVDIHKSKGLQCVSCHPGNKEHNMAKGNSLGMTVRDDLDNSMPSCEDCHNRGKNRRAPRYRHPFSPRHMKRIACQTCHIPYQTAPADLIYDHASTGSSIIYETSKFLPALPGINTDSWSPTLREFKDRIIPVKSLIVIYWGDLDEKTNVVKPIFLWKIREKVRELNNLAPKDGDGDGVPEVNTTAEIKAFLKALKGKDKFGNPIANRPVLIKGGSLYQLNKTGEVEKIKHEQAESLDLSLSHNVVSGSNVIGSGGCGDCHSENSPFFLRKILVDPYDESGKPVYIEAWQSLGISKEKLDQLLLEK